MYYFFMDKLSEQLREFIRQSGMSHQELSRETGVPQPTITRFMNSTTSMLMDNVDKLAAYFGLTLCDEETGGK